MHHDTQHDTRLLSGPVNGSGGQHPRMSTAEALDALGLEAHAGAQEIRDAHRRLMQVVDPRSGGTPYLGMKINEAREVLLGE